jgi:pyruvate-formate lyase-activating enzyme
VDPDSRTRAWLLADPATATIVGLRHAQAVVPGLQQQVRVKAFDGDPARVGFPLIAGRWFAAQDEAVAPEGLLAAAHLAVGGVLLAFGRACEGEPLLAARLIEAAVTSLRRRTSSGVVHVETNGSLPAAIRRLIDAGVDSIALRVASARAETHDTLTGPEGFRLTDVRASLADAVDAGIAVALVALVMPGVTDRERESDALLALAGALPPGSRVVLRDLAADPERVRALLPTTEEPHGVERMIERLRAEAPHATLSTHVRPLVRA